MNEEMRPFRMAPYAGRGGAAVSVSCSQLNPDTSPGSRGRNPQFREPERLLLTNPSWPLAARGTRPLRSVGLLLREALERTARLPLWV